MTDNPGSEEARKQGCTCPIIDNHYGKGRPTGGKLEFIRMDTCPLHGLQDKGGKRMMLQILESNAPTIIRVFDYPWVEVR